MSDRAHLLRSVLTWGGVKELIGDDLHARALDAVDAQEDENQRLRDALEQVVDCPSPYFCSRVDIAREALAGDAE